MSVLVFYDATLFTISLIIFIHALQALPYFFVVNVLSNFRFCTPEFVILMPIHLMDMILRGNSLVFLDMKVEELLRVLEMASRLYNLVRSVLVLSPFSFLGIVLS